MPSATRTDFLTGSEYPSACDPGKMDVVHDEPPMVARTLTAPNPLGGIGRSAISSDWSTGTETKNQFARAAHSHSSAVNRNVVLMRSTLGPAA